jgi:hypothetical protein
MMHASINRQSFMHFLVTIPNSSVIATNHKGRVCFALFYDGIQDTSSAKTVIVAAETMILKEKNPWSSGIFLHK